MKQLNKLVNENSAIIYLSEPIDDVFEKAYVETRIKEERILTDEQVSELPRVSPDNAHHREWQIREHSAQNVVKYFRKFDCSCSDWVLDIGCGNGWFSHLLAENIEANVLAVDINRLELEQAARVFSRKNLYFAYLDLFSGVLEPGQFSLIIFNSSFQYFQDPDLVLEQCLPLLAPSGEIHIIDSPFYEQEKIAAAKSRTEAYYQQLETEKMIAFYHHHSRTLIERYNAKIFYQPSKNKAVQTEICSPFPWIMITQ
ncbi:class I SAM-dependent methyltransferase [Aliikangiella coralliicola]|nr:class I SAM-dependent methyltransferase [Aliikangiella coralliicola]